MLIITGSMGAGKTSVLAEASDILSLRQIVHAAIDLDSLGLAHLPSADGTDSVMYRNLESVCGNYAASGVTRLLLARAMEDRAELELCQSIVSAANTPFAVLSPALQRCSNASKVRESGMLQQQYVDRVAILDAILNRAALEDFVVVNENRSLNEVAQEMLIKARWISADAGV